MAASLTRSARLATAAMRPRSVARRLRLVTMRPRAAALSTATSADGTPIAYASTAGDPSKPPLVLIPGWGGVGADFAPVRDLLAAGRTVVTFDPRGMGASGAPAGGAYGVEDLKEDALAVARAAGSVDAPVDVLGHSLGGLVAQELAFSAPSEVRKVVLASTAPGGDDLKGLISRDFFDVLDAWTDEETRDGEIARRRAAAAYYVHGLPQAFVEDRVEDLKALVDAFVDGAAHARTAAAIAGTKRAVLSPSPAAARFAGRDRRPTLVLHGDVDAIVDPFCGMKLAEHIPGAKLLLLAGVGHHAYTQEPDEWARLVADFLDDVERERPPPPNFGAPPPQMQ